MKNLNINDDEIDILKMAFMIFHKAHLIISITLMSVLISIFSYYTIPNTYTSKINVQLNLDSKENISIPEGLKLYSGVSNNSGVEIELIKSRKLLSEVIKQLKLNKKILEEKPVKEVPKLISPIIEKLLYYKNSIHTFFKKNESHLSTLSDEMIAIKTLQNMLSISYTDSGKYLAISIKSYSPILSTKIVNTIADIYINYKEKENKDKKDKTLTWLSKELNIIKEEILRTESELSTLSKDKNSPEDIKLMINLKKDEINTLSISKNELEQKLEIDEIHYKNLYNKTDPAIILESPLLKATPAIERSQQEISLSENKLLELSFKYGPKHPTYIIAKERLENEKNNLKRQVYNLLETYKSIFEVEKNKLKILESLILNAKYELQVLNQSEEIYSKKMREIEAYQNLYNITLKYFQEAQSISNFDQQVVGVLDYSLIEDSKINNNVKLISYLIVILGFLIGIFIIFFLGITDQKIYKEEDLFYLSEKNILINLPKVKITRNKKLNFIYDFIKNEGYLESIYRLRTRLRTINSDKKIISITSSIEKEGKSTIAIHLAKSLSEIEKVLIIDIDFRRQSITKNLNIPIEKPGLSDVILQKAKLSNAIIKNTKEGFDILSAGTELQSPNTLLSSDITKKILIHLKKYYDRIIIETPPVQLFSDAEIVSSLVDTTLVVIKSGYTKKKDIVETIETLEKLDINILGIILNNVPLRKRERQYRKYIQ